VELDQAGILVHLSHMAPAALDDALRVTAAHDIAPVVTHGVVDGWRSGTWAATPDNAIEIYLQGDIFAMGPSATDLQPGHADDPPAGRCWGTVEAWAWHQEKLQDLIAAHADELLAPGDDPTVRPATGWSSDWNGWLSHSWGTHGPRGCYPRAAARDPVDLHGLAHVGEVDDHLDRVVTAGVDRGPRDGRPSGSSSCGRRRGASRPLRPGGVLRRAFGRSARTRGGRPGSPGQRIEFTRLRLSRLDWAEAATFGRLFISEMAARRSEFICM
jgi:hypothetical protein